MLKLWNWYYGVIENFVERALIATGQDPNGKIIVAIWYCKQK